MPNKQTSSCRLCGEITRPYLFDVRGHTIHRCPRCGFVQVAEHPDPRDLLDIYKESYFDHGKYHDQDTLRFENLRRLKMVERTVEKGSRVLEVGCGEGSFINICKSGYEISGLDVSTNGIEIAKQQNPEIADRIWAGSIEDYSGSGTKFDAICLWDVLEHIWDPAKTCQKLLGLLTEGGKLFISTPNIGALTAWLLRKRWAFMTPPEHLGFFSPKSVRFLFEHKLQSRVIELKSRGKKVNLGFLLYKFRRVFPQSPGLALRWVEKSPLLSKAALYIPTSDIQYIIVEKGCQ